MNKRISKRACQVIAFLILSVLATGPVLSQGRNHNNRSDQVQDNRSDRAHDKQRGRAHDKQRGRGNNNSRDNGHDNRSFSGHDNRSFSGHDNRSYARFGDRHRKYARKYYDDRKRHGRYRAEHTRRYVVGRQLPRDVVFYEIPRSFVREFGPPPRGYRYVRVSNDILLINSITGLVADALRH